MSMRLPLLGLVLLAACSGNGMPPPEAITTTSNPETIGDGTHFGVVTVLEPDGLGLELDEGELLSGTAARRAAEEAGDVTTRGGHYVRDLSRAPVSIGLAPELEVRLLEPCCSLHRVSFDDWLDGFEPDARSFFGTSKSYYEITVVDGKVVAVDEVQVT